MNSKKIIAIVGALVLCAVVALIFIFKNNEYKVTFDSKGGSVVETQTIKESENVSRPSNPTRTGYTFDNWYLDDAVYDFSKPITKDITLVAKWIKSENTDDVQKYNVSFDTDGGNSISSITVEKDKVVSKPANPIKDGYNFVSWQLNGEDFDFTTKITKDIKLTATWKKNDIVENTDPKPSTTVAVTSVVVNKTTLSLEVSKTETLVATVKPNNATNKKVAWSSSDTSIASVNQSGVVTAKKAGTAIITAKSGNKTANCTVTVTNPEVIDQNVSVNSVSLNETTKALNGGSSFKLVATLNPSNATNKNVTWSSNNTSVATVNSEGKVVAIGAGTAIITVKTIDGEKTASCTVTVTDNYTYTLIDYELSDLMYKVKVSKNNIDITSTVERVLTSSNANLGAYDSASSSVLVNKSDSSKISKALISGKTYTIIKK